MGIAYFNMGKGQFIMKIAYARVSTTDQNLERQLEEFRKLNIDKVFSEKISGKNTERQELQKMLDYARENDELYVVDFSRLSRSVSDLLSILRRMEEKGVRVISLKENFDTSTPTGKLMVTMIGAINEFERQCILERQREGIAIAKREGVYRGRPPKKLDMFDDVYIAWKNGEITAVRASELLGITRQTFYNRIKQTDYQKAEEKKE